jgi:NAD(P)-dependent dehydrogenase (short-subunit alcohol dehydrogenase family)
MSGIAIVTGAGSGIGLATAKRFLAEGRTTVGVDLGWSEQPEGLHGVTGDVSAPETWAGLAADIDKNRWTVKILVLAAARLTVGTVLTLDDAEWQRILDVNLFGVVRPLRVLLPLMIASGGGSIVTVGSVDGYMAEQGLIAYCTSKGGLLQLTRTLAMDHARDGIRANCVCPGVTDTPFFRRHLDTASDPKRFLEVREQRNPLGRLLDPDEVAATIAFVASDAASGMTGAKIVVDAGLTASFDFRTGNEGA